MKIVVFGYLFCMLGIFPLYYKEEYYRIGDAKFELFWNASLGFIGISFVFLLINMILNYIKRGKNKKLEIQHRKKTHSNFLWDFLESLSALDYAVFIYALCVLLSYGFSDYKEFALKGASGWEMGLCSQIIFVVVYFILSKQKKVEKETILKIAVCILIIHLIASGLVFIFGILHRFDIDPLGMYVGLELYQKVEFLSTIGQATWFSSYVCTVFAIGMTLFYMSHSLWIRVMSGVYTAISFGILVTQNSDSAFVAIAGIMLLLGWFSLSCIEKWSRFWQILCLMWGTFGIIGVLQRVFAERTIPLESISIFFSQSMVTWVLFIMTFTVMIFYGNCIKKNGTSKEFAERVMKITRIAYKSFLIILVIAMLATVSFIYLNTKGYLLTWFGYQSTHPYLLFDYHWGSNRGSTWMICWQAFWQMPFYQKLFGVGPDSLAPYLYSIPEISDLLHGFWGNVQLTNAHNEYLNSLLCYGIVGATSWLIVLIVGMKHFYQKGKENSFMIAFVLCIMGYACHNIFCYQQVCCTPILFILLGMGESLTKFENFNTI